MEPDLQKLEPDLQTLEPNLQKLEPDLQKLEPDLQKSEPDLQKLEPALQKLEPGLQKLEADLQKLVINLQKLEIDLQKLVIDLQKLVIDLQKLVIDLQKLEIDLKKVGIDAQKLGSIAAPPSSIPAPLLPFAAMLTRALLALALALALPLLAQPAVLPERARPDAVNHALQDRLDNLLPALMREQGIDMWLVINREYVEDPVYLTLVPEPVFAARRTTILVFFDRGAEKGVERLTVSRYPFGAFYNAAWEGGDLDAQWKRLGEVIKERNPKKIAVNTSRNWPFADGLTHALHTRLMEVLDPALRSRVVSAEPLVVRWLETRTAAELESYPTIVAIARHVITEAFSNKVITPGVTTTDDVVWYIRQRYAQLGLPIWFHPDVNVQRPGLKCESSQAFCGEETVIRRGDVLHTDVGITYLRMNTDTQEMGYVLKLGETDVPEGLKKALATGNRWQDILTSNFVTGRTGNEILAATRAGSQKENIASQTYTHPLGFFGHAAGPTIGMWDNQNGTSILGDWKLSPNTAYAIEGNVKVAVPEWGGQLVQIKLEQSAVFDGTRVHYLAGRQTEWHVVE